MVKILLFWIYNDDSVSVLNDIHIILVINWRSTTAIKVNEIAGSNEY